ncbi:MAG: outer membrane beta-barrel protein [Cyclobacteriaceae bacterium]|nr:outer membrane beta-barrel protein [Cyclobacteriaceae bacterium]
MKIFYLILLLIFPLTLSAQETGTPPAHFDVIIKINGDIIYGMVTEVTFDLVKYKRTDIPDGPVYQLLRSEVYAISYRNQLKEILNPGSFNPPVDNVEEPFVETEPEIEEEMETPSFLDKTNLQRGEIRLGVGFIPSYSKIDNKDSYNTNIGFPPIIVTYLIPYKKSLMVGIQLATGTFNYSRSQFDDYDQIQTQSELKENLFQLSALGKYQFTSSDLRPYAILGLSLNISSVNAESTLNFVDDDRTIFVKSGVRNTGMGVVVRAGLEYSLTDQIGFYTDLGTGVSLIQLGGVYKLNK